MLYGYKNLEIKKYLDILKCKGKCDKLALEGSRLILEAIRQGVHIYCLFFTQKWLLKDKKTKYDLTKYNIKHRIITEKAAKVMSAVNSSPGIFAIAKKNDGFVEKDIKKGENILALYEVKDPSNLGILLRSAFCFGFLKVVLYKCCDIYNPKVIRASMGAIFGLCFFVCKDFDKFLKYLNLKKIHSYATVVDMCAKTSKKIIFKKGVLVLGGEANGLTQNAISKCSEKLYIDMYSKADSLNVAVAGSIFMYEMENSKIL